MSPEDQYYFALLKDQLTERYQKLNPECSKHISELKGQEIVKLQDSLSSEAYGRVSEKWFYTHIKQDHDKLPRVDMLDLLSRWLGYDNWNNFLKQNIDYEVVSGVVFKWKYKYFVPIVAVVMLIGTILILNLSNGRNLKWKLCFRDYYTKQIISNVEVELERVKESNLTRLTEDGCIELSGIRARQLVLMIKSKGYKSHILKRVLSTDFDEQILLKPDDYGNLIKVISKGRFEDWKTYRDKLERMIAPAAKIFQVDATGNQPIDFLTREEFIDKLTLPFESLKEIDVLETIYKDELIWRLRFSQIIR